MRFSILAAVTATLLGSSVLAHPGHDIREELAERAEFLKHSKKDLSHCAASLKRRGIEARNVARRSAAVKNLRKKRSLSTKAKHLRVRDAATVLNTTHLSSTSYNTFTNEKTLFSGNNSCLLSPEVTQGPYFVSGEYIRRNLIEDQEGVELIVDMQVLDVATCEPVVDAMIDFWHCNATGVYSGIVASGNGDSSDATNINNTWLRGLQPTQYDGVAQLTTIFPGHYTSRATHIHVLAHLNGTILPNSTYSGGTVSHVGQIFFDQDLISQVESTAPYNTNTQELTTNANDAIFTQEAVNGDPVVEYSLLGDSIEDGVFAWIAFGVDLTADTTITPAAFLYAEGGVANSNSGGGGGGGSPPNGTAPPS